MSREALRAHKDWDRVTDKYDRLEKQVLLPSSRTRATHSRVGLPPEFFDENPREFREEGPFIAMPRSGGTLRLYFADWGMRTFLVTRFVDKNGWWGKWQDDKRIAAELQSFKNIKERLDKAISYDQILVNDNGWGFRRYDEQSIATRIYLNELP